MDNWRKSPGPGRMKPKENTPIYLSTNLKVPVLLCLFWWSSSRPLSRRRANSLPCRVWPSIRKPIWWSSELNRATPRPSHMSERSSSRLAPNRWRLCWSLICSDMARRSLLVYWLFSLQNPLCFRTLLLIWQQFLIKFQNVKSQIIIKLGVFKFVTWETA